jgi:hypothetical protein
MYDLIGDIHGHASALEALLRKLGYRRARARGAIPGPYRHPERKAIFVGDFIDRGPEIRETLLLVRPMVESGAALAVMGNHEFNALAYHTPDPAAAGAFLRPHTLQNQHVHGETLRQLAPGDLESHLSWFRTLPLWLELGGLRVVHACWDEIEMAGISGPMDDAFLTRACQPGDPMFRSVEILLKGKEMRLPNRWYFLDKEGRRRVETRVRWYAAAEGATYASYAWTSGPLVTDEPVPCTPVAGDAPIPAEVAREARPYPEDEPPVFVGHYWLPGETEQPTLLRPNVACIDWSVARGGVLCAYRWDGEQTLDAARFVTVKP